jgi:hypothetical protein
MVLLGNVTPQLSSVSYVYSVLLVFLVYGYTDTSGIERVKRGVESFVVHFLFLPWCFVVFLLFSFIAFFLS